MKKNYLWFGLLVACITFTVTYTYLWIGLHNFDICNNERVISLTFDIPIMEQLIDNNGYWSLDNCISAAQGLIIKSIFTTIMSSFMLGFMINEVRRTEEE